MTVLDWAIVVGFLLTMLVRRSGVITDCELVELRYSGRPAAALRAFMACLYLRAGLGPR